MSNAGSDFVDWQKILRDKIGSLEKQAARIEVLIETLKDNQSEMKCDLKTLRRKPWHNYIAVGSVVFMLLTFTYGVYQKDLNQIRAEIAVFKESDFSSFMSVQGIKVEGIEEQMKDVRKRIHHMELITRVESASDQVQ